MSTSRIVPASNTNHTYHSAGVGSPDYTALATWEAATDVDLSGGGYSLQLLPGTHNDALNAAGSINTDATHFRRLWVDPNDAHAGVIGAGVILAYTGDAVSLYLNENNFQVHDLQVSPNINSGNNRYAVWLVNPSSQLVGVIVAGGINAGEGKSYGIIASAAGCKIINSLIVGGFGSNDQADVRSTQTTGTPLLVANTTIVWNSSAVRGLLVGTPNMCTAINVIADRYGTACFSGTFTASDSNVSSDSSAPGTNPVMLANLVYVAMGTDFHLSPSDRAGIGTGADQSSSYTDDVDNNGAITTWYPGYDSLTLSLPTATIDSPPDSGEAVDVQILGGESINLLSSATGGETPYAHEWEIVEPGSGWVGSSVADPGVTTFNVVGTWTLRYTVEDNLGNIASDERTIVVGFPPAPIADAGPSQNVPVGGLVQLDGSGSYDPEGVSITYLWAMIEKPGTSAAALSNATIVNPTFTPDVPGTYVIGLVVNDGEVNSPQDHITVMAGLVLVVPGTQYTQRGFTTAMGGVSVIHTSDLDTLRVEATSGQAWVTLNGCTVTLGSLGTNDFTIQGTQANLLAAIASLSYTGPVKGEQAIILTATDVLGYQDTKFFTVMVLNNAPVITSNGGGASTAINVEEDQTAVTTVVATDLDPSDDLVYSIVGGEDAAKFSIDSETGVLTFVEAPDHDIPTDADLNNVYEVIVQVTDGEDVGTQALSVTVTIVPIPVSRSFALPVEWRYEMKSPSIVASMEWGTIVPALFIEVPMELALAIGKVALVPTEARGIHVLERSASHEWIMNLGVEHVVPTAWLTTAFSPRTAFADYWGPVTVSRLVSMESRGQIASITQVRTVGHEWVLAVSRESGLIPHWHGISVSFQSSPVLESSRGMLRLHVLPMEWVVSVENAKSASSESLQSPIASLVLPHEALGLVRSPREVMDEARQWLASPYAVTGEWTLAYQVGTVLPVESLRVATVGGLVPYEDWGMHGRFFVIPFEILKQI